MNEVLRYRGRVVTSADVEFIRDLLGRNPTLSRRKLSKKLCEAWGWVQPNGAPRDMVCRGLMLELHRGGHIELPPVRMKPPNPLATHPKPTPVLVDKTPVKGVISSLGPFHFRQVRRSGEEPLFNWLIEAHHYLGYTQPVGEHLKYMVYARETPVACLSWSSAPRHLAPRDKFIGWSREARRKNIRFVAYNSRYLIFPWVEVRHLASHILGRMARLLSSDWQRVYDHPVYYLETFVDTTRFKGTCYRAANWMYLGRTTGRGKNDNTRRPNRPLKDVLGYPLTKRFRQLLGSA